MYNSLQTNHVGHAILYSHQLLCRDHSKSIIGSKPVLDYNTLHSIPSVRIINTHEVTYGDVMSHVSITMDTQQVRTSRGLFARHGAELSLRRQTLITKCECDPLRKLLKTTNLRSGIEFSSARDLVMYGLGIMCSVQMHDFVTAGDVNSVHLRDMIADQVRRNRS